MTSVVTHGEMVITHYMQEESRELGVQFEGRLFLVLSFSAIFCLFDQTL